MMPQVIHDYLGQLENLLQTCRDSFAEVQRDLENGKQQMAQPQYLEAMAHAFNVHQNLVSILHVIQDSNRPDSDEATVPA